MTIRPQAQNNHDTIHRPYEAQEEGRPKCGSSPKVEAKYSQSVEGERHFEVKAEEEKGGMIRYGRRQG